MKYIVRVEFPPDGYALYPEKTAEQAMEDLKHFRSRGCDAKVVRDETDQHQGSSRPASAVARMRGGGRTTGNEGAGGGALA